MVIKFNKILGIFLLACTMSAVADDCVIDQYGTKICTNAKSKTWELLVYGVLWLI